MRSTLFDKETAERQRFALVKTRHAAQTALSEGALTDCLELLEGYWPRFQQEYTPQARPITPLPAPPVAEQQSVSPESASENASAPTLGERFRSLFRF